MRRFNGFTLVELAIVLSVVSIVAAYVVPDFIEMARSDLAQASARDMLQIQDAARWFYHDRGEEIGDAERARWPGELMTPKGFALPDPPCQPFGGGSRAELINFQYLAAADFVNPWGIPYDVQIERSNLLPGNVHWDCQFVVTTSVPQGVAGVIKTHMPDARCDLIDGGNSCPGAPAGGNDRCCSRAVRPGYEASLMALAPLACDNMMGAEWDTGLAGSNSGECNTQANLLTTLGGSCFWANEGAACGDEYLIMGGKLVSCGKGCEATQNYCCKANLW